MEEDGWGPHLAPAHWTTLEVGRAGARPPKLPEAEQLQHLRVHVLQPVQLFPDRLRKGRLEHKKAVEILLSCVNSEKLIFIYVR